MSVAPREFVFEDDRPFAECHAASIAPTADGGWWAVWFGGSHERHPDVAIWGARRGPEGGWSAPRLLARAADEAHWNPVIFRAPDGRLHLWFKTGVSVPVWRTWTQVSDDDGRTWSPARVLVPGDVGGRGPVKNKPIVLSGGDWLAGASVEVPRGEKAEDWDIFLDRSDDAGATWRRTPFVARDPRRIAGHGMIQPTLWESAPGHVHLLARSTCRRVCRSDSQDGGRTWSPARTVDIPHNNSGIDLVRLAGGALVLCCNPIEGTWPDRSPLSLLVSRDDGATWSRLCDLEDEKGAEFSYPAIVADGPDAVAVAWTWKRKRIAFRRVAVPGS